MPWYNTNHSIEGRFLSKSKRKQKRRKAKRKKKATAQWRGYTQIIYTKYALEQMDADGIGKGKVSAAVEYPEQCERQPDGLVLVSRRFKRLRVSVLYEEIGRTKVKAITVYRDGR